MNRVFKAGTRFAKMRNLCVFVNMIIVFVFYFIYRYLLEPSYPGFVGTPLVILMVCVGAAIAKATIWFGNKLEATIRYEITKDYLIVGTGKVERKYPWANFTEVCYDKFKLRDLLPVYFMVGGEKLTLNQYVDEIYDLAFQIIRHLDPKVPVDQEITNRINAMR